MDALLEQHNLKISSAVLAKICRIHELSIVVPVYNGAESVAALVERCHKVPGIASKYEDPGQCGSRDEAGTR